MMVSNVRWDDGMREHASFLAEMALKWRPPPQHLEAASGYNMEAPSVCQIESDDERDDPEPDPAAAPEARGCAPELRQARGCGARDVHRGGHVGAARGRRTAGRRGDRDALPALPDPPGPARGRLRGRGRGDGARGGRSLRAPALGGALAVAPPVRRLRRDETSAQRGAARGGARLERAPAGPPP